jgi:hypothetical protein
MDLSDLQEAKRIHKSDMALEAELDIYFEQNHRPQQRQTAMNNQEQINLVGGIKRLIQNLHFANLSQTKTKSISHQAKAQSTGVIAEIHSIKESLNRIQRYYDYDQENLLPNRTR